MSRLRTVFLCGLLLLACILCGCASPSRANIGLRKQNADLREQLATLQRQREADAATIKALEANQATVDRLPAARLESLFTVHSIELGRLTGGQDTDPDKPGDEALRVVVTPKDQTGQNLKAAGTLLIEAFDLSRPSDNGVGRWEIDLPTARRQWHGSGLMYAYVFELPWQSPPARDQVTVKVTFNDELTGRSFSAQRVVPVKPPPAS